MPERDEWGEPRLRCPDCGGPLNMVVVHEGKGRKARAWYCPAAIGESAFDRERRLRYIPEPSSHRRVIEWRAADPEIAEQLFAYGPSGASEGAGRERGAA